MVTAEIHLQLSGDDFTDPEVSVQWISGGFHQHLVDYFEKTSVE